MLQCCVLSFCLVLSDQSSAEQITGTIFLPHTYTTLDITDQGWSSIYFGQNKGCAMPLAKLQMSAPAHGPHMSAGFPLHVRVMVNSVYLRTHLCVHQITTKLTLNLVLDQLVLSDLLQDCGQLDNHGNASSGL